MSKNADRKLALADLMVRAEQRQGGQAPTKDLYVPLLQGCLTVTKIPLGRVLSLMDGMDGNSMADNLEFQVELIYQCCPLLRDRGLQQAYQCQEPTDIVCALLEDNLGAISEVAAAILAFYGLGEEPDPVKN